MKNSGGLEDLLIQVMKKTELKKESLQSNPEAPQVHNPSKNPTRHNTLKSPILKYSTW